MKKLSLALLSSAAIASFGIIPSAQAADLYDPVVVQRVISGDLQLYGGYAWIKDRGDELSVCSSDDEPCGWGLMGGMARVDVPFSQNFSLQLDMGGNWNFAEDESNGTDIDQTPSGGILAGGHLNWRNDTYLFGVFGAGGSAFADESSGATGIHSPLWAAGVEGQWYMDNITLYAQVGFMDSKNPAGEGLSDTWFVRGEARYFLSEYTRLMVGGGFANGDQDVTSSPKDELDLYTWNVRADHQVHGWGNDGNVSLFAEYSGLFASELERTCCEGPSERTDDFVDHRFMVGVSFALNQPTLLSQDRTGATLNLPDFSQWYGAAIMSDR